MAEQSELVSLRTHRLVPDAAQTESLVQQLERTVRGEVRFDRASRGLYARDASNFRMVPIGVVIPKDEQDVVATLEACRAHGAPVLSRGGGTSLAGQCCNAAVVMDFTKYMGGVKQIMPQAKLARVAPGTILDELRDEASKHGLTFGPDPATHDHCALGGMIGNNSCGVHAVQAEFYGPGPRVQDNVHELEILLYDGTRMRVGETSEEELEEIIRGGGRRGEIYRQLRDLRDRYANLIRERFPDIPRRVSGYNLTCLLPENGFNVAQALVGTEGTCVTVLEATVKLIPAKDERALLVLGFDDIYRAGDAIPKIRGLDAKPIGCEGLDDRLIQDVEKKQMHDQYVPLLPEGKGWLIVQFGAEDQEEALEQAEACLKKLKGDIVDHRLYSDDDPRHGIWQIRESGLGATAFVPGQHDTWPGWEDSAVPPEKVGAYLRDLRELFDEFGYEGSFYGHLAQGCIHTRIPFHLTTDQGLADYREFTRRAAELVVSYGGSLSGEHGDGVQRGELLPIMFGEELVQAFREFKAIWDPDGRMNPGKVVDPMPRDANLALGTDYEPWDPPTHFPFAEDERKLSHAALRCVGVGKCRQKGGDATMCPSFVALHEEEHTTRGRAHLLYEMVRGEVITDGWKSEEVKDSLDLCLSCKGCTNDCPVNVDIPTLKAEFLSHYYEGRLRPRHAYAFGLIDRWARLGSLVPEVANFVSQTPGLSQLAKWAAGVHPDREIPPFAKRTFRSWYRSEWREHGTGKRVILWPDTFNNHFFPDTLAAAAETLRAAGYEVVIPPKVLCCGRPLFDYGMLDRANAYFEDILSTLEEDIEAGTPVVGAEPSCMAALRDELVKLRPDDELAKKLCQQTHTVYEFLMRDQDYQPPKLEGRKAIVHWHCHHKGAMGKEDEEKLLQNMGLELEVPQKTCCGMAGSFGFEKDHYWLSQRIGEHALLPAVRQSDLSTILVADGFSCREQVMQSTHRRPLHSTELIQLTREGRVPDLLPERQRHDEIATSGISAGAKILGGAALIGLGAFTAYKLLTRAST